MHFGPREYVYQYSLIHWEGVWLYYPYYGTWLMLALIIKAIALHNVVQGPCIVLWTENLDSQACLSWANSPVRMHRGCSSSWLRHLVVLRIYLGQSWLACVLVWFLTIRYSQRRKTGRLSCTKSGFLIVHCICQQHQPCGPAAAQGVDIALYSRPLLHQT